MNRALRELGLGPDADERAVKRAYAARLKVTRPDSDPEGFQALNAAYQAALAWVQSRSHAAPMAPEPPTDIETETEDFSNADEVPSGAITRVLTADALFTMLDAQPDDSPGDQGDLAGADTNALNDALDIAQPHASGSDQAAEQSSTETVRFDFDAFFHDCVAIAVHGRDGELLDWLNAQPILWSLAHKAQIAHWLIANLHEHRPAIQARRFDVLAEFFGLLDIHAGYDAYVIQRLRHRMHLAWEIQTRQTRLLAERCQPDGGSFAANLRQTQRVLGQLCRPLNLAQALFAGLTPRYPTAARKFLHRLDFGNLEDLPAPIDPRQVAFWNAAGDRSRLSLARLQIGAARCVAYSLLVMLLVLLMALIAPEAEAVLSTAIKTSTTVFAWLFPSMLIGWLILIMGQACQQWQSLPEREDERFGRLRTAFIPATAALAIAVDLALDWDLAAAFMAVSACLLAWRRYRSRNGALFGFAPRSPIWYAAGIAILLGPGLALLGRASHIVVGLLCAFALALWTLDLRKQRHTATS